jgi:hypothetical protein
VYIDLPDGSYNSFGGPRTRLRHRLSRVPTHVQSQIQS